jgi:hypothetical protein
LQVFLPIAGLSVSLPLLVGVGFVIEFLSGLAGVGGGFLPTPALMVMGISPSVAAASGSNTVVATSAFGVAAHFRLGNGGDDIPDLPDPLEPVGAGPAALPAALARRGTGLAAGARALSEARER